MEDEPRSRHTRYKSEGDAGLGGGIGGGEKGYVQDTRVEAGVGHAG